MDWANLPALLAIERYGTLRNAAAMTRTSAATLSRRLDDLEDALGQHLVERLPVGCKLTLEGELVLAWATEMESIVFEIERMRDVDPLADPQGIVRINADEWMSFFITARLKLLHELHPRLGIEIITTHRTLNVVRREADIVLSYDRPTHNDLVVRRVGTMRHGLFGAKNYVDANAEHIAAGKWEKMDFVGFDELRSGFDAEVWLQTLPGAPQPWMRCSYALGIYDGVVSGAGLGVLATFAQSTHPSLVAVQSDIPMLRRDIWLSMHRALSSSARIRAVSRFLAASFESIDEQR